MINCILSRLTVQGFKCEQSSTGEERAVVPLFIASLSFEEVDIGSPTSVVLVISLVCLVMFLSLQGLLNVQYLGPLTLQAQWCKKKVDYSQH